ATLPPAMVHGMYDAYRAGREHYQANRGEPNTGVIICCAWLAEHGCNTEDCKESQIFRHAYDMFSRKRVSKLAQEVKQKNVRRVSEIVPLESHGRTNKEIYEAFAQTMLESPLTLHHHNHTVDKNTQKRVSFGLIR